MAHIPVELLGFLRELAENNNKEWFTTNKQRYLDHVKAPSLAFIEAFGEPLSTVSPHFLAIPKAQGGSLFRIYRDTRFGKDKTPYKTGCAMQFRHELTSKDVHAPGFYFHMEPGGLSGIGAGIWMPPNPVLNTLRQAIVDQPERWTAVKEAVQDAGLEFMTSDKDLKRIPRGFDAEHVHSADLRRKSFAVHRNLSDEEVCDPELPAQLTAIYQQATPLVEFICDALDLPF